MISGWHWTQHWIRVGLDFGPTRMNSKLQPQLDKVQLLLRGRKSFIRRLGFHFVNVSEEESSELSSHGDHQSPEDYDPAHCTFRLFSPLQSYLLLGFMFYFILFFIFTPVRFVFFTDFFYALSFDFSGVHVRQNLIFRFLQSVSLVILFISIDIVSVQVKAFFHGFLLLTSGFVPICLFFHRTNFAFFVCFWRFAESSNSDLAI